MLRFTDGSDEITVLDHAFLVMPYGRESHVFEFRSGKLAAKWIDVPLHELSYIIKAECRPHETLRLEPEHGQD